MIDVTPKNKVNTYTLINLDSLLVIGGRPMSTHVCGTFTIFEHIRDVLERSLRDD